jgi:hypothetical protein
MKRLVTILILAALGTGSAWAQSAIFIPMNGNYAGLFFETNGFWDQSSGIISISTTTRGRYSARLQIGNARYSLSGQFNGDGQVERQILRYYENPLTIKFQVDPEDADLITGTVSDGTWTAELFADRAVFDGRTSISPDAGQYTMALLGDFTSTNTPGGASVGTVTIDKAGWIRFAGSMADGTRFTQATRVSKDGLWPLYAPLYRGSGSLYGWLAFNGTDGEDLSGDVTWIKPQQWRNWYYPNGFAILQSSSGSRYTRPPRGTKVLDISNATIEFNGGNLGDSGITNRIQLDFYNRIRNSSANGLRLSISLSNGSFTGSVMDPITWDWMPFRGVILQRQNVATGYFLDWNKTGEVWLQAE